MPQFAPELACGQRSCAALMNVYGYHALVCRGHSLPHNNMVRGASFDLMIKVRYYPSTRLQLRVRFFRRVTSQLCDQHVCLLPGKASIMIVLMLRWCLYRLQIISFRSLLKKWLWKMRQSRYSKTNVNKISQKQYNVGRFATAKFWASRPRF